MANLTYLVDVQTFAQAAKHFHAKTLEFVGSSSSSTFTLQDASGIRMVIGGSGQMHVIKSGLTFQTEKEAEIAVSVFLAGLLAIHIENEILERVPREQGEVERGTNGRLVFALGEKF